MPTLYDVVRAHAERFPDKLAVLTEVDGTRTFSQLALTAGRLAHGLVHRIGMRPGDRACLWMVNRPEWVEAAVALAAAGIAVVPADPRWTDTEIAYVVGQARCRLVVCDRHLAERAVALRSPASCVEHVLVAGAHLSGVTCSFDELIDEAPRNFDAGLPPAPPGAGGGVLFTSGTTTGRPKGVVASAELLARGADYETMFGLTHCDRVVFVTPLFHGNGAGACLSALTRGGSAVFPRRFSAHRFWHLVDLYRPTYLFTLVPVVNILMSLPPSAIERSHGLRVLIVLGAGAAAEEIEARYGAPVMDWYGMTEAGSGTYTRLGEERRPGSAGKPFDGSQLRILREDGTGAAPGEVGEVAFARASIGFDGYLDDPAATAAAVRGEWFLTGDLGYLDGDGYFYFVDRKKDIVRRGGENVSSLEVEAVLRGHPGVGDVAVVGRPDAVLGERVVAFVVPATGHEPPSLEELRQFAGERLAPSKLPEDVVVVADLPRTGTGKVEKFRLRERRS